MIRERLSADLKSAINAEDPERTATLRLISAAVKDRDFAARAGDNVNGVSDPEILGILGKMVRQREESARDYEESGRLDLAEQERNEIGIISAYIPRQFSQSEISRAVDAAIADTGAKSIRDISRVMAHLKSHHAGRMDFNQACSTLKNSFR